MSRRGFAGRADLLRAAVAVVGAQAVGSKETTAADLAPIARLLDLHPQPQRAETSNLPADARQQLVAASGRSEGVARATASSRRPPLPAAHFALVETAATPPRREPLPLLTRADCQPRRSGSASYSPLVGRTRLWPALQRALASPLGRRAGGRRRSCAAAGSIRRRLPRVARRSTPAARRGRSGAVGRRSLAVRRAPARRARPRVAGRCRADSLAAAGNAGADLRRPRPARRRSRMLRGMAGVHSPPRRARRAAGRLAADVGGAGTGDGAAS